MINKKAVQDELLLYSLWSVEQQALDQLPVSGVDDQKQSDLRQQSLYAAARCAAIESTISRLPPFERAVLQEYYICGSGLDEIAEKLGCSRETADQLHDRALSLYQREKEDPYE